MQSLLTEFTEYNPNFIDSLNVFDDSIRKKFIKKLKSEKDKQNFRATIAEVQFGKVFKTLNLKVEYDKKYRGNLTPDWTINDKNCSAIVEVYRLGKTAISQARGDFEDKILMAIRKIKKPYIIQLTFKDADFIPDNYDLFGIISNIQTWMLQSRELNDNILLQDLVELNVYSNNSKYDYACFIGNSSSIEFKTEKLKQNKKLRPNEITKKLIKYQALIKECHIPYFLAVSIDFTSGFDIDDFKQHFLGTDVYNIDFGADIPEYHENKIWGKNWTELGLFYNTPNLSGLILRYNNANSLLLNPVRTQVIYDKVNEVLLNKLILIE